MIAIIAGGTGLTGRVLIEELEHDSRITEIRALVRTPGSGARRLPRGAKLTEVALPPEGFAGLSESRNPALSGDLYFCALGTTIRRAGSREAFRAVDFDAVVEFGRLCAARKGRCFALVSSIQADASSSFFYLQVKGQAEEALRKLALPRLVIARPSTLIGDRDERRPGERFMIQAWRTLSPLMPRGLALRLGTSPLDLARALIRESLVAEPGVRVLEFSELGDHLA